MNIVHTKASNLAGAGHRHAAHEGPTAVPAQ